MTKSQAIKDLILVEIDALKQSKDKVFEFFMEKNVPKEIILKITEIWDYSKEIGGSLIAIGKIIIMKIIAFVQENSSMAFGMALGGIVGAFAGAFVGWIPFLGNALSSLSISIGIMIGAVAGSRMDRASKGEYIDDSVMSIFTDAIAVAKTFIAFLMDIFQTLKNM